MAEPLSDDDLRGIVARDAATDGGYAGTDYSCAQDRHLLLQELNRLRSVVARLQAVQPVAKREERPWRSE